MKRRLINSSNINRNGNSDEEWSEVTDLLDGWRSHLLILIVTLACYVNGLRGDFVHDDIPAITMNRDVLGHNPLSHLFLNDFWGMSMGDVNSHKSYRPLTTLTFRINYLMFGLEPLWFHMTNILLHAFVCVLFSRVCFVVAHLERNFATMAGILFALHPIHTEAVTGIVGRADVLACVFFLLSILTYHGNCEKYQNLSIILGGLSMLAKETGMTVFLVNLAYDTYRSWPSLRRSITDVRWSEESQQFARRLLRISITVMILLLLRIALLQGTLPKFSLQDNPAAFHSSFRVRLLTFLYLAAFNWWLLLCPVTLSHDWQMGSIPLMLSFGDLRNLLTLIALLALLLLALRGLMDLDSHRQTPLVLGFLLLTLPFLPASNIVITVGFVVAERILYIPSLGSTLLVVYGVQVLWQRLPRCRRVIMGMCIILTLSGSAKTIIRNEDWLSRESLLRSGLSVLPHNAKMHYNFGNFLRDSSQPDLAMVHYERALSLWPMYSSAHNNLGTLLTNPDVAEYHFMEAIRYSSDHVNAHYNLGKLYRRTNRTLDAVRMLERCIKLESRFVPGYLELYKLKSGHEAGRLLKNVIKLSPRNLNHLYLYGNWLLNNNSPIQALEFFLRALRLNPYHQMSFLGTCHTLRRLGQLMRLQQLVLRWHILLHVDKGPHGIHHTDLYLREWQIKMELRSRAKLYDSGLRTSSTVTTCTPLQVIEGGKQFNCSRSERLLPILRDVRIAVAPEQSVVNSGSSCYRYWRIRKWPKSKRKSEKLESTESVVPLLVSSFLDKL
ncbi:protein O-mannosyl-transferase TMTC1-like [Phlebotomus argentipes]|uniref:protein O-mannosyl-transferase TMTC1-like n=1 Tax=Phlebotomus argentipes TaxID=94469 RepID=UPI0028931766|nr:protein O-mannosyl-transferase TMTC1-like [Phlebotomus argentipes]